VYFVEYNLQPSDAGYCPSDRPLNVKGKNRENRTFLPKPEYDNRRVETFHTQDEASYMIGRFNFLIWCEDLIAANEKALIEGEIARVVQPLIARIEALEAALSPPKKTPRRTTTKK